MTQDKDFKRRVRERIAKTGESYTAARAQLLADSGGIATPPPEEAPTEERLTMSPRRLADSVADALAEGRTDDVRATFDEPMLRAISLEYLDSVVGEMEADAGAFREVGEPVVTSSRAFELFDYPFTYERYNAHVQVAVKDDKVAGLVVLPGGPTGRWKRSRGRFRELIRLRMRS